MYLKNSKIIVVKIGSSLIVDKNKIIDKDEVLKLLKDSIEELNKQ